MQKDKIESGRSDPKSPAVRRAAYERFAAGKGYKIVAKELALSQNTVRDWLRQFRKGVFSIRPRAGVQITPQLRAAIVRLRDEGWSWREIEIVTGLSKTACRYWFSKAKAAGAVPSPSDQDAETLETDHSAGPAAPDAETQAGGGKSAV